MRLEVPALASKPGFLNLKGWASQNDHRVIVEARWASEADFRAAVVDNPEARSARATLESLGKSEPGIFVESFQQGSRPVEVGPAGESVAFIQVWDVGTPENQQSWLRTMRARVGALTDKPGFDYLRAHTSADGKRTAVYAQWHDQSSLEAGVRRFVARAGQQALRGSRT